MKAAYQPKIPSSQWAESISLGVAALLLFWTPTFIRLWKGKKFYSRSRTSNDPSIPAHWRKLKYISICIYIQNFRTMDCWFGTQQLPGQDPTHWKWEAFCGEIVKDFYNSKTVISNFGLSEFVRFMHFFLLTSMLVLVCLPSNIWFAIYLVCSTWTWHPQNINFEHKFDKPKLEISFTLSSRSEFPFCGSTNPTDDSDLLPSL